LAQLMGDRTDSASFRSIATAPHSTTPGEHWRTRRVLPPTSRYCGLVVFRSHSGRVSICFINKLALFLSLLHLHSLHSRCPPRAIISYMPLPLQVVPLSNPISPPSIWRIPPLQGACYRVASVSAPIPPSV